MTTKIIIIAIVSQNGVIGKNNDVPWRISDDFKRFKTLTMGFPCIMGRVTYESLPDNARPLPGRENIVITSNHHYQPERTTVQHSLEKALDYVRKKQLEKVFIIGGSVIYQEGLKIADVLELTQVHCEVEGNVYFPKINWAQWILTRQEDHKAFDRVSQRTVSFSFQTYQRSHQ